MKIPHGRSSPRKAHAKPAHVTPSEARYAVELARSADMLRQRELAAQHARAEAFARHAAKRAWRQR